MQLSSSRILSSQEKDISISSEATPEEFVKMLFLAPLLAPRFSRRLSPSSKQLHAPTIALPAKPEDLPPQATNLKRVLIHIQDTVLGFLVATRSVIYAGLDPQSSRQVGQQDSKYGVVVRLVKLNVGMTQKSAAFGAGGEVVLPMRSRHGGPNNASCTGTT